MHDCVCTGECLLQGEWTVNQIQRSIRDGKKTVKELQQSRLTTLQSMFVIATTLSDIEAECDLPLKCTALIPMLVTLMCYVKPLFNIIYLVFFHIYFCGFEMHNYHQNQNVLIPSKCFSKKLFQKENIKSLKNDLSNEEEMEEPTSSRSGQCSGQGRQVSEKVNCV